MQKFQPMENKGKNVEGLQKSNYQAEVFPTQHMSFLLPTDEFSGR